MVEIKQAITTTFENFNFVVETLNKATTITVQKVVGNFIQISIQGGKKGVETRELTSFNRPTPILDSINGGPRHMKCAYMGRNSSPPLSQ